MYKYYHQRPGSDVSVVSDTDGPRDELVSPISDNGDEQQPRATSSFYGNPPQHQTIIDGSTIKHIYLPSPNDDYQAYAATRPYDESSDPLGYHLPPSNLQYLPEPSEPQPRRSSANQEAYERLTATESANGKDSDRAQGSSDSPPPSMKKWWKDTRSRVMFVSGCTLVLVAISGIASVFVSVYKLPRNKERDGN